MIIHAPDLVREVAPASWGSSIDANSPLIGYHSIATPSNIVASSQDPLYPASNMGNPSTIDKWLASSVSAQTVSVATGYASNIDYVGIAKHNFGTAGALFSADGLSLSPNLLLRSNEFTTSPWSPSNGTVTPNAVSSPIPGYNGWLWSGSISGPGAYVWQQVAKAASALTYTGSIHFKKAVGSHAVMHIDDGVSGTVGAILNFATGTISVSGTMTILASGVVALSNGWYRVWITFTSTTQPQIRFFWNASTGNGINGPGSNTSVYAFGADLSLTSTLQPYKPTTTASSGWFALAYQTSVGDDAPIVAQFTPQILTQVRFNTGAASVPVRAGVLFVGKLLTVQRRLYVGHVPITMGYETNVVNGISESGEFLGRRMIGEGRRTSASFRNLTPDWVRTYLKPFLDHARDGSFFWTWRPGDYPSETGYGWLTNNPQPTNDRTNGMMKVDLQIGGVH